MKSNKEISLNIGIPAYNEEKNITRLVKALLDQKQENYQLMKIIIVSDGSTDKTVKVSKQIKSKKVQVITNLKRKGKSHALSQIFKLSQTQALLLLDADVMIKQNNFVSMMVEPIVSQNIDLSSAQIQELRPTNFFEKLLAVSMKYKKMIFESYSKGNNLYTCHGRALISSKRFYKAITMPRDMLAEDAYSYLFCVKHGFKYQYQIKAKIYYRLPKNLEDHSSQSSRFIHAQKQLSQIFGEQFVSKQLGIPARSFFVATFKAAIKHPLSVAMYFVIYARVKLSAHKTHKTSGKWHIAESSKLLINK